MIDLDELCYTIYFHAIEKNGVVYPAGYYNLDNGGPDGVRRNKYDGEVLLGRKESMESLAAEFRAQNWPCDVRFVDTDDE